MPVQEQLAQRQCVVLVVDDDEMARSVLVSILKLKGHEVLDVPTPLAALEILRSRQTVDLLVTDVHMPGTVDGTGFVKMARSIRPELKVLYATGYADEVAEEIAVDPGARLLAKPFPLNTFISTVSIMMRT